MTDNRTNEPTEAMIEAAAKALHETRNPWIGAYGDWGAAGYEIKKAFRESARAALEAAARAAQGAAPQAESEDNVTCRCGHGTGSHDFSDPQEPCREIVCDCRGWFGVSPALPSSGVDEQSIRDSIARDIWNDEQECNAALRKAEIGSVSAMELGGKLAGLQRARDITQGVLVRNLDEDKLAEVIGKARTTSVRDNDGVKSVVMESNEQIARAVAEWLKGQGR